MRLTRVIIENFRGIRRLKLYLDPITVIIGENNHGKTSIFDVLALCLGRPGSTPPTHFRQTDFHRPSSEKSPLPIRVSLTFESDDGARPEPPGLDAALTSDRRGVRQLQVEVRGDPADGRVRHRFVDHRGRPLDPQPPEATLAELRRRHPVLLLRFAQRAQPEPDTPPSPSSGTRGERGRRRELEAEVERVYHELANTRGPVPREHLRRGLAAAHELFESMKLRRLTSLAPLKGMLDRLLPDPEGGPPDRRDGDLEEAGSGSHTLGLLMVLGAMLDVRGETALPADADPIIAIEEPEVHLHPILLASTWDVIESLDAQTLVTTNSGELLSSISLHDLRRLTRKDGLIQARRLHRDRLSATELRRVGYHIRAKRGGALFARCWLLVEGESEFWLLRQLAHVLGYDLEAEGVRCVEFAQCGVAPLVKLANDLGIEWHLLSDGDASGAVYAQEAQQLLRGATPEDRITRLTRRDIERCFWYHGYEAIYLEAANLSQRSGKHRGKLPPGRVIEKAVRKRSKPYLALTVAEAAAARGPSGIPTVVRHVIETSVNLARGAVREESS